MTAHSYRCRTASIAIVAAFLGTVVPTTNALAEPPTIQVYKTPSCGCCKGWVGHLRESGFTVTVEDLDDLTMVKRMTGVPQGLEACHTAVVDGYTIEGHVPATAIERLLRERPEIAGLAAPGMPEGSPGMPSPTPERYDVMAFDQDGARVFGTFVGADAQ